MSSQKKLLHEWGSAELGWEKRNSPGIANQLRSAAGAKGKTSKEHFEVKGMAKGRNLAAVSTF